MYRHGPQRKSGNFYTRRKFLITSGAALGAAALVACGGGRSSGGSTKLSPEAVRKPGGLIYARDYYLLPDETANAVPGGVYPGRSTSELHGTTDPYVESNESVRNLGRDVYEFLVRANVGPGIKPGSPESLKMIPKAAESWEVTADGLTYTFKLRPGVKYHNIPPVNGREMTIDDWRTSLERFLAQGFYRSVIAGVLDKAEYPDSRTMVWRLKEPYSPLIYRLEDVQAGFALMPRELNENPALAATTPIGTNYRVLTKNEPSVTREYSRHEQYWGGKPFIERWRYPIIPEYANAQAQFVAKNIINFSPSSQDVIAMRRDVPEALLIGNEVSTAPNTLRIGSKDAATAPWKDVRVRIAMRRAVDWQAITDFFANKAEFAQAGIEVETSFSTHAPSDPTYWLDPRKGELGKESENYLYDPAEAKKLLEAAGFPNGFEIPFYDNGVPGASSVYTPAYYQRNELVAKEYEKTGLFKTKMNLVPYKEWTDEILTTWRHYGFTIPWGAGGNDVDAVVFRLYHSSNKPAYPDPRLDQLVEQQRREPDPLRRAEVLKEFQRQAAKVFPSIPVQGAAGTWTFEWPWLHNVGGRRQNEVYENGHLMWLDPNMPNRNG